MIIGLIIVILLLLIVVSIYNSLVRLRVTADTAWSDIDVQLKRRHDLIPNIVETVKGYAGHERQTLEAVTNARSAAMSAQGPAAKAAAEGMLTQALKSLFAIAEAYPQLRAVESFNQLQSTLSELEDAIQNARRYYNAVVRDLNTKIAQFPSNIIAGMFSFRPREFFEMPEAERAVPQVKFDAGGQPQ
jgi:LemA protein